jgi:hypothetical protein
VFRPGEQRSGMPTLPSGCSSASAGRKETASFGVGFAEQRTSEQVQSTAITGGSGRPYSESLVQTAGKVSAPWCHRVEDYAQVDIVGAGCVLDLPCSNATRD